MGDYSLLFALMLVGFAPVSIALFALSLVMTITKTRESRKGNADFPILWLLLACVMFVPGVVGVFLWLGVTASNIANWIGAGLFGQFGILP